jgi:membrane-associated phospholipid phosphatase
VGDHLQEVSAPDPARPWRILCLTATLVALATTTAVFLSGVLPGESLVRTAVRGLSTPVLTDLARQVNHGGSWRVLVPATCLLLAGCPPARQRWWLWCCLLVLAPLVGELWQEAVGRPRPVGSALGFPSGHATATATFAVVATYLVERTGLGSTARRALEALPIAGALAVGVARLVLDAHWPADVLGGFAVGGACAAGGAWWDAAHPRPAPMGLSRAPWVTPHALGLVLLPLASLLAGSLG